VERRKVDTLGVLGGDVQVWSRISYRMPVPGEAFTGTLGGEMV